MFSYCTGHGLSSSSVSGHSRPLPLVGLYTFAASSLCFLGLTLDLYRSLRHRKIWVATSIFPLNAASLALLTVATKPPSDISTAMPGDLDQLVKLTSVILMCAVMTHVAPSLGLMSGGAKATNLVALGILVATLAADIWIQLSTGAILPTFALLNLYSSVTMLILFFFLVSHALTVTTTTRILEEQYDSMNQEILRELPAEFSDRVFSSEKLVVCLNKYWLMSLTSSPDFSARSSLMPVTMSILCHSTILATFFTTIFALPTTPCLLGSDYRWSIPLVFLAQVVAILVGTVVSLLRALHLGLRYDFVRPDDMLRVERHYVQMLVEWRELPLSLQNRGRTTRRFAQSVRHWILTIFLQLQIKIVLFAKSLLLISIYASYPLSLIVSFVKSIVRVPTWTVDNGEAPPSIELDAYVLQLEGEKLIPKREVVRSWSRYPAKWVATGRDRHPPVHLLSFLKHHRPGNGLGIANMILEGLPTCWALSLANLATIGLVVRDADDEPADAMMSAIREGFKYARLVDYGTEPGRLAMRKAADLVWEGVDLYHKWLDVSLDGFMGKGGDALVKIREISGCRIAEDGFDKRRKVEWSARAMATYSMHEIVRDIVADTEMRPALPAERVDGAVSDALRGCLRQLPRAIVECCSMGRFGDREQRVREAALVLGEVEGVLKYLEILHQ